MKAIYTKVGNDVYRINQGTFIPTNMVLKSPGVSSNLALDTANKNITQNIYINNLQSPGVKSNAELVYELKDFLREKQITEIKTIQNFFKVYIDYTVHEDGREIEHSAVVRPIKPIDKIVCLGVATNDECVYRRVKTFNSTVEFRLKNSLPYGIMSSPKKSYVLKIHSISIFQDFSKEPEIHNSVYENPYRVGSSTMQHSVDNMKMIYSTENEGIDIQEISSIYIPRTLSINLEMVLADYVVVYNDQTITDILIENIENKYPKPDDPGTIVPPDSEDTPPILIPGEDNNEEADGNYEPDENGYFSYYEKCKSTTPNALLVVEDLISDGYYDPSTMIKKAKVIKDLPDIEVGEYVILRESIRYENL